MQYRQIEKEDLITLMQKSLEFYFRDYVAYVETVIVVTENYNMRKIYRWMICLP